MPYYSNPDYRARRNRALELLLAGSRQTSACVPNAAGNEYDTWLREARARLSGIPLYLEQNFPILDFLGEIIEAPRRHYPDLLRCCFLTTSIRSFGISMGSSPDYMPSLRHTRLADHWSNVLRALRSVYRGAELPLPDPVRKLVHEEVSRRFVRSSLSKNAYSKDDVAIIMGNVAEKFWPSIIGCSQDPFSDETRCATIWQRDGRREVMLITHEGAPIFLSVPVNYANSNEAAVRFCEREIRRVMDGYLPLLKKGSLDFVPSLLDGPDPEVIDLVRCGHDGTPAQYKNLILRQALDDGIHQITSMIRPHRQIFEKGQLSGKYSQILNILAQRIYDCRDVMRASLDQDALNLLGCMGMNDLRITAWLTGVDGMIPAKEIARHRTDAEEAFMATGPLFNLASRAEFRAAVVERRPLVPVIREITGLTRAQVRAFSELPLPNNPKKAISSFPPFDPAIFRIGSAQDISIASLIYGVLVISNPEKPLHEIAAESAKILLHRSRFARLFRGDFMDAISHIDDSLIMSMVWKIHGGREAVTETFLRRALYPRTLTQLHDVCTDYHNRRMWQDHDDGGGSRLIASWHPLTQPLACGTKTVRELCGTEQIRIQGQKQGHCVGVYAENVLAGDILIVSIDKENGDPSSTVELAIVNSPTATKLVNEQHKAAYNQGPPFDDMVAINTFIKTEEDRISEAIPAYMRGLAEADKNAVRIPQGSPEYKFHTLSAILPRDVVLRGYKALVRSAMDNYEKIPAPEGPSGVLDEDRNLVCYDEPNGP